MSQGIQDEAESFAKIDGQYADTPNPSSLEPRVSLDRLCKTTCIDAVDDAREVLKS